MTFTKHTLAALLCATLISGQTMACGYDMLFDNPFTEGYPGAFDIALSTRQAIVEGQLQALQPLAGTAGLARASGWLNQVRTQLESSGMKTKFAVYLVDSRLWTRFDGSGAGVLMQSHQTPQPGDSVLLLSEATLSALLSQQMTFAQARDAKLVSFTGKSSETVDLAFNGSLF
ncbi:hypothetical protein [Jeongeupia chitinilytica]|uniref:Uncharacterized protein n=1 Tax=Jeongeupia chitinilytica TaxID=1041641 RepID=A0ABQ3H6N3_9NEIS|nr:hypothetical protein [Jeongeupia chitinilytica]GHD69748.1 hypothetical protein GCM10007350_36860 [Jeongeupia chitinilytica]